MGKVSNAGIRTKNSFGGKVEFSGKLTNLQIPDIGKSLYYETSGEVNRFYALHILRNRLFESIHVLLYR